jgi:hypothetical protein
MTVRRAKDSSGEEGAGVIQKGPTDRTPADGLTDAELYENSLRLLKAVRAAVFYLFYFVRRSVEPPKAKVR